MATNTVASAIPSSHPQTTTSPDDSFPSRERAIHTQHAHSARTHGKAVPRSATGSETETSTVGDKANETVLHGNESIANAQGENAIAVAVGDGSRAAIHTSDGSYQACVIAVGTGSEAEASGDGIIASVAVGIGCTAVSNTGCIESIAIGYEPFARADDIEGTAIAIGCDPVAQADDGGYLVFIDTTDRKPEVAVFAVDPEKGIWPNIPYWWRSGWAMPCPDTVRIDREGYDRAIENQKKSKREIQ